LVADTKDLFAVGDDDVIDIFRIAPGAKTVFRFVGILNIEETCLWSVPSARGYELRVGGKA